MEATNGIKLNALFLIDNLEKNFEQSEYPPSTLQFTNLVKTCGIDITVAEVLPDNEKIKNFDLIFIDLQTSTWAEDIPIEIKNLANCTRVIFFNALFVFSNNFFIFSEYLVNKCDSAFKMGGP